MMDLRKKTAELIKKHIDIPEDSILLLFEMGFLEEHVCKKILIREEYYSKYRTRKKTELKIVLAEKYCVSIHSLEKYISVKNLQIK